MVSVLVNKVERTKRRAIDHMTFLIDQKNDLGISFLSRESLRNTQSKIRSGNYEFMHHASCLVFKIYSSGSSGMLQTSTHDQKKKEGYHM